MFQIKICGITHRPDAIVAAAIGADAIGLNFFEGSKRYLPPRFAPAVAACAPANVCVVGVFVNATVQQVCRTFDSLPLNLIQLAGDETPDYVAQLGDRPVMKAFRISSDGLKPVVEFLEQTEKLGHPLKHILLDANQPGEYGGTGHKIDWPKLARELENSPLPGTRIVLAGGLTPDNVCEAIAVLRPAAVDVASGVEYAPGRKDAEQVDRFVRAAQDAFANM